MRFPFVFQLMLLAAVVPSQEQCMCRALLPPCKILATTPTSTQHNINDRPNNTLVRNSLGDGHVYGDSWEDENTQGTPSGQRGDFFRFSRGGDLSGISPNNVVQSIQEGYKQRVAADPSFLSKSILEIVLAACTQYTAEVSRRGKHRILTEIDFVFAGILTAVCGKYFSMWRVARTVSAKNIDNTDENNGRESSATNWRDNVPTNAFQPTLLDGVTVPTFSSRFLAFILPMPQLFRAGVIASTLGYGLTNVLIIIRSFFIPQYVPATKPVSVPLAAIYTGLFMAFVSNVRYQLLQGVVEPYVIDGFFFRIEAMGNSKGRILKRMKHLGHLKRLVIVLIRWLNGLLGSWIAIGGMSAFGLQKLKE
ncbi:hypothetical protein ACHAXR_007088 [Thalassiosira sp. AJA248-18]